MAKKKFWKVQTKLEKCLLLSFFILGFTLLGLIIFIVVTYSDSASCKTPTCISTAYEILNNIDQSVNPCEDFFAFACGNIVNKGQEAKMTKMKAKINKELNKLMEEPINAEDHYLIKNEKTLFQICMNESTSEDESLQTFKKLLDDLNGWPVFVGNKWDENLFDWKMTSYKLRQNGLLYASVLDFGIESDPLNISRYLLQVKEPFIDLIEEERKALYINFMIGSLVTLGAERSLVKRDMEEVFDFRQRLYNESIEYDSEDDKISEGISQRRMTIKQFQQQNNDTNWVDFINNVLNPIKRITEDDYVLFSNKHFIGALNNILNSTPKRVQANYIFWNVYESLVGFFPKQYRELEDRYNCQIGSSVNHKSRSDFCKRIIRLSFDVVPTEMLYVKQKISNEFTQTVAQLIKNIKEEFISLLNRTKWMDEISINNAIQKVNTITEIIGTGNNYQDDPVVQLFDHNETIHNGNDSFLRLYLANRRTLTDMLYARIDTFSYNHIFNKLGNDVNAAYSSEMNTIALHAGILQDDLFDPKQSNFRNYGMLGSIIGHEITHGFCKDGSAYDGNGKLDSIWTNATEHAYQNTIKCLVNQVESFEIYGTNLKMNGTQKLEETIADVVGVKASYNAYKKWVSKNREEASVVGLEYTPYQLFWISTASHYCYKIDQKNIERILKRDNHALNTFRAIGPLKNNKDFAIDFNCPVGSKMNPIKKCEIFG